RFAQCFTDYRAPELIEHTVEELVAQRVLALACGYEDLNDHDVLRDDALLAVAAGKRDATGATRKRARDRGHALAGKSTLNRLEGTPAAATAAARYKKIVYDGAAIEAWFVEAFLAAHPTPPAEIVLDLDATDDPLHGQQEGRFFHGYYRAYCYLPLYIFAGDFLLAAKLRRASGDGAAGAVEEVARIVAQLRAQWPGVRIVVRGDSGFARDALMSWCEAHAVDYVLGLARNARLEAAVTLDLALAEIGCAVTRAPVLVETLRRVGLAGTALARAQVGRIRTRLLKLGALVTVSVRRVVLALSSVFPLQPLFAQALGSPAAGSAAL